MTERFKDISGSKAKPATPRRIYDWLRKQQELEFEALEELYKPSPEDIKEKEDTHTSST